MEEEKKRVEKKTVGTETSADVTSQLYVVCRPPG